ncbi:MAG: DNA-binding domain-containing protein [Mariprofundus sp.]|nr:DNA-binding domain-containing protein [Mariprofundus sp.]
MKPMPSLAELQDQFFNSVMHDDDAVSAWVVDHGLPATQRMQIYKHMVENTLSEALATSYPAILALVGVDFFALAVDRYMRRYPPESGNLQDYGAHFPTFLSDMQEAASLPYLSDVARLEWARQLCYLAADTPCLNQTEAACRIQALGDNLMHLCLHPSVGLIDSEHRIFDIWQYCTEPNSEHLQLTGDGQSLVLWRDGAQVAMQIMDSAAITFLQCIEQGMDIYRALNQLHRHGYPDFDVSVLFSFLVANHLITDIQPLEEI